MIQPKVIKCKFYLVGPDLKEYALTEITVIEGNEDCVAETDAELKITVKIETLDMETKN